MIRDVHSYSSSSQGRIRHLSIQLRPDLEATKVHFRARYIMDLPVHRRLYLDDRRTNPSHARLIEQALSEAGARAT